MELATWSFLGSRFRPANLFPSWTRTTMMATDRYAGKPTSSVSLSAGADYNRGKSGNDKMYTRLDSCLVIPPARYKKPRAIVMFLGGAFVGAVPEVTYSYLKELLAKEGYLIVSVPHNVTFDHERAAKQVYERFNSCLDMIISSGIPGANLTPEDLADLPLFSVGHSASNHYASKVPMCCAADLGSHLDRIHYGHGVNGALLQVLTGCYFSENIPKANAIISFNNRSATEAVPYFKQLGPLFQQMMPVLEASPVYSIARSASGDALKVLLDTAGATILNNDQEALISLTKFVDQLPSVFDQVTQGVSEFRPTPLENRNCFKNSYNVQHTLLVKFSFDTIDDTDLLEETLRPRVESYGGTLEKVQLSGNHLTPCIQDPRWQVGPVYTPADAIAQGLKTLSLNETRLLSRTITDWFKRFEQ